MEIQTKHFGKVTIEDEKIVFFQKGIFGFESIKKYAVLYDATQEKSPFAWLQSIEERHICLPMINPLIWFKDYAPEINDDQIREIGELDPSVLEIYSVVVVPEDIKKMTTNLKAPILINRQTKNGIQVVVDDSKYNIKENLYEHIANRKEEVE